MAVMAWFKKEKKPRQPQRERLEIPPDVWEKCEACGHTDIREKFERQHERLPELRLSPPHSGERLLRAPPRRGHDGGSSRSTSARPTRSASRTIRRASRRRSTNAGDTDALLAVHRHARRAAGQPRRDGLRVHGRLDGLGRRREDRAARPALARAEVSADPRLARRAARACRKACCRSCRWPRSSAVLAQLAERRIPYISILTNPTTGGVSASYAMLGDAILAEPGAVIGFAGPRVIKQTLGQDLPEGFQTSEFLLEHGMLDCVVAPPESQAHREPAAAPHVGPPGGDGVERRPDARSRQLADYRDALDFLFARTTGGFKFGLERTRALLDALGNPQRALSVASRRRHEREGKQRRDDGGAARARRACASATYTSPHLVDFRERMVVDGAADSRRRRRRRSSTRYTPLVERDRRELLRGDHRDGVRLLRARAAPTSRSSRPASADGSTRPTCSTRSSPA